MNIYPVNSPKSDKNRYCGPSAISIVTGMATGEAARLLRYVNGKCSIKGVGDYDMIRALKMCGITTKTIYVKPSPTPFVRETKKGRKVESRPTLAEWFRNTASLRTAGRVFLVSAGHHWQIVSGRRFCCGITKEIVGFTHEKVMRRARVREVFELLPAPAGISIPAQAKKENAQVTRDARDRAAFKSDCQRRGYDWIKASDDYIEIDPCDDFPDGLTFLFDGWADARDMVDRALRHPEDVIDGYISH